MRTTLAVVARPEAEYSARVPATAGPDKRLVTLAAPAPLGDPVRVFEIARRQGWDAVLWHLPNRREALVGIGAVATLTGEGEGRFQQVARAWHALTSTAVRLRWEAAWDGGQAQSSTSVQGPTSVAEGLVFEAEDPPADGPAVGPLLMGGFAFAPGNHVGGWASFGDGRLWVPRWVYQIAGDRAWIHVQAQVPADADMGLARHVAETELELLQADLARAWEGPPTEEDATAGLSVTRRDVPAREEWLQAVATVVEHIRAGELEKAVLARTVEITATGGFAPAAALRHLEAHYPDCYVFAVAQGNQCFLGATPERLVRLRAGQVEVACLAGSIGRGRAPEEDDRLGAALLQSAKDRHEHRVVLDAILDRLAPLCASVAAAPEPTLLKFANVQHLYTPVRARLRNGATVLDLAARLHPTPAIGGHPTERALDLIGRLEAADRGWYAGPVGWVDGRGQGEFAVALRSALVQGHQAWLYAGCGVMADSDPEGEFAESCLKLRPMLAALGAEGR